jgi:hypothetical protein
MGQRNALSRRKFVGLAGVAVAGSMAGTCTWAEATGGRAVLFDGKTLEGWNQLENNATSLSSGEIPDPAAFTNKLANGTDAVSTFVRSRLDDSVKAGITSYSASGANAKATISALVKELNQMIAGPSIYDAARFGGVVLRPETSELLKKNLAGLQLARLNVLLLLDAYPRELTKSTTTGWIVRDGAMASTGSGRGVIYTAKDYSRFRLMFTMRHVSGMPDHQACVLIFCTRPGAEEMPLDALGGIQFQVPNGGHWDYRPGKNTAGGPEFTAVTKAQFDVHAWSRIEILADAKTGTARMAVAQPPGSKAIEVLDFRDPVAGKSGPIAWQMHNAGLFDEYRDVTIEVDPSEDALITVS